MNIGKPFGRIVELYFAPATVSWEITVERSSEPPVGTWPGVIFPLMSGLPGLAPSSPLMPFAVFDVPLEDFEDVDVFAELVPLLLLVEPCFGPEEDPVFVSPVPDACFPAPSFRAWFTANTLDKSTDWSPPCTASFPGPCAPSA